jgi:hypothetical protein
LNNLTLENDTPFAPNEHWLYGLSFVLCLKEIFYKTIKAIISSFVCVNKNIYLLLDPSLGYLFMFMVSNSWFSYLFMFMVSNSSFSYLFMFMVSNSSFSYLFMFMVSNSLFSYLFMFMVSNSLFSYLFMFMVSILFYFLQNNGSLIYLFNIAN